MNNKNILRRKNESTISASLTLILMLCCSVLSYISPYAADISFFICFILCTYLISSKINPIWFLLLAIPPVLWLSISGSVIFAALSVIYIIPAFLAGAAIRKNSGLSRTVIFSTAGMCIIAAAALAAITITAYSGNLNKLINDTADFFKDSGLKFAEQTKATLENSGYKNMVVNTQAIEKAAVELMFVMPGAIILLFEIMSYIGLRIVSATSALFKNKAKIGLKSWGITADLPSSCVFLISIILTLFRTSNTSVLYITALNISVILMPFFVIIGIKRFFASLKNPAFGCIRISMLLILVFMIFQPVLIIYAASLSGAVSVISDVLKKRRKNQK